MIQLLTLTTAQKFPSQDHVIKRISTSANKQLHALYWFTVLEAKWLAMTSSSTATTVEEEEPKIERILSGRAEECRDGNF